MAQNFIPQSICRACNASIGWAPSKDGKGFVPIDKRRASIYIPDAESPGRFALSGFGHVSHFLTCTNPSRFSKSNQSQAQEVIAKKLKFVRMAIDCAAAVGCIAESPSVPCDCPSCQVTAIAAELKLGGR